MEDTPCTQDFLKGSSRRSHLSCLQLHLASRAQPLSKNGPRPGPPPSLLPSVLPHGAAPERGADRGHGELVQCSEAVQKHMERVCYEGQDGPELLVACADPHVGDLSEGPVLKKVAQQALKLPSTGEGVQFYLFEHVDSAQQFRQCPARPG